MGLTTRKPHYGAATRRKADLRSMTDVEAAYVGALVDGEGCISKQDIHCRDRTSFRVVVANTELELISALLRATGIGRVFKDGDRPGRLRCWRWSVGAIEDVKALLRRITPFSVKAQRCLEVWSDE